jgi:hypothetical protein
MRTYHQWVLQDTAKREGLTLEEWLSDRVRTIFRAWLSAQKNGYGTFADFKASVKTNFDNWLKEKSADSVFRVNYTLRQFFEFELEVKAHLMWVVSD